MRRLLCRRSNLLKGLLGFALVGILFSACKKDSVNSTRVPAAGLMAFNLSPDQPAVAFRLSGNYLGNNTLAFTNYTGSYLPVYVGTSDIVAVNYNANEALAASNAVFSDSLYYSTFLLGANGKYWNVTVEDKLLPLRVTTGKAWVRYINAIPDSTTSPLVSIASGSETVVNTSAPYSSVSEFVAVASGTVNVSVTNGSTVTASRSLTFEDNKVYTILFVGLPNTGDADKAVQIKYITNGVVTQ